MVTITSCTAGPLMHTHTPLSVEKMTQKLHKCDTAFIFACVKLSRQPLNCDSLSHIVYIKILLRKAFIFSFSN